MDNFYRDKRTGKIVKIERQLNKNEAIVIQMENKKRYLVHIEDLQAVTFMKK